MNKRARFSNPFTAPQVVLDRADGLRSVLVVYDHVPRPGESGADLRLVQIVELLRDAGHHVTLIGRNADSGPEHVRALEAKGVQVLAPDPERTPFQRPEAPAIDLAELCRVEQFDVAILYQYFWSGIGVGEQYLPLLRLHAPSMRIVVLSDDCHALREQRKAETGGSRSDVERARGFYEKEADSYHLADALWTITNEDAGRMRAAWPELAPRVVTFAQADVRERVPGFAERDGFLFLGSGANDANVQAVRWFVREVLPRVRAKLPQAKLCLVGEPPAGGWGFDDPSIETVGRAADLAPHFDRARVFVSPVTYGTGLKTKNVQALGHGLPAVLTTISAEGLGLEGELAVSVCDDPEAFAARVVQLHEDAALWSRCSAASLAHARAAFGRERTAHDLEEGLRDVIAAGPLAWPEGHVGPSFRIDARDPSLASDRRLGRRTLAHVELARELARAGAVDDAVREVRMAFCDLVFVDPKAPAFGDLHAQLAVYYAAAGEHEECVEAARAAVELNPDLAPELRAAAERARDGAQRALESLEHPRTDDERFAASARCFARGELERAAEHLLAVLDHDRSSVRAWNDLGAVLWRGGVAENALEAFENALAFAPDDANALANRASVLAALGQPVGEPKVR
ncbi:MAG: glycosyltransferase [Planctomycetes bacterium]|nr:glycosyltransferase [Planctomycetota bacterium]